MKLVSRRNLLSAIDTDSRRVREGALFRGDKSIVYLPLRALNNVTLSPLSGEIKLEGDGCSESFFSFIPATAKPTDGAIVMFATRLK